MLFNSIDFLVFFLVVTTLYYSTPHRFRWFLLLFASCYFYMVFVPVFILILAAMIVIDYVAGTHIEEATGKRRLVYLIISLVSNVGILAFFKYFNFLSENLSLVFHALGSHAQLPLLSLILPLGLSFHTFQAMSYTVEVYRGRQKAERHFGIYALYVMFYPQMVAGPIERPYNLIHQFKAEQRFDAAKVTSGLQLMLWGFFKKIVVADRLAVFVSSVYDHPQQYDGLPLIIATVFFAFQIYCDFSGYTDIAIGAARVMGIDLIENFRRPYFARSVAEFWQRWHISLSSWFRDYVYIPLGGSRVGKSKWFMNILITFALSGIWHGASWNFLIWGMLNGLWYIFSGLTANIRAAFVRITHLASVPRFHRMLQMLATFSFICFSWIFFRAHTLPDALYIATHSLHAFHQFASMHALREAIESMAAWRGGLVLSFIVIGVLIIIDTLISLGTLSRWKAKSPVWLLWLVAYIMIFVILFLGAFDGPQFIYFQF